MQNSKLYSILERFDKYEQNRLKKFLTSPYFNRNEALVLLFELLVGHINSKPQGSKVQGDKSQKDKPQNNASDADLDKTALWGKIYPGESYDDVLFRKNCSDLLKLIEDYLAQQVYEENSVNQATFLIEAVSNKKLEKLYNTTIKSARRLAEQQSFKSVSYYHSQYMVERNYFFLLDKEHDRTNKKNEEEMLSNLDKFFMAEKLRFACYTLSQKNLVSHEYNLLFVDEIVEIVKKTGFEDTPPISVYYQIYLTYIDSEETDHYFKLRELMDKYGDVFPRNEAEFIYEAALNYCMKKINRGLQIFMEEYLNITEVLLQKGYLLINNELSPWHFRNIVGVSLRLGKFDWTESFINSYQKFLPFNMRENAVSFNLAMLYFYQKRHNKVKELLQTVEYEDFSYNLNSKAMLLSSYYEMDEIEPLYSLMDSFRTYLNRHKDFSTSRRVLYTNLIKFTKQLTKIIPGDKKALEKLKKEVEEAEPKGIASITWLKEKIAELE